jgi:tryptophan synthase alpha subunit
MRSLSDAFEYAKQEGRLAFIGYLPSGYPTPDEFVRCVIAAGKAGMDILEIGLPASDPKYDGDVIRKAHETLYHRGFELDRAIELGALSICMAKCAGIAMMYGDTLMEYGENKLLNRCNQLGISGILSVGMGLEEWIRLAQSARQMRVEPVPLLDPEVNDQTLEDLVRLAQGYLYLPSKKGPSGGHADLGREVTDQLRRVKQKAARNNLPVAIGFGIRNPEDIRKLQGSGTDGIIVGTALVEAALRGEEEVYKYVSGLVEACYFNES